MVKSNFFDDVLFGVTEIIGAVSDGIAGEFKGTNPFDKEPISRDEMRLEYNMMSDEQKMEMAQTYGLNAIDLFDSFEEER